MDGERSAVVRWLRFYLGELEALVEAAEGAARDAALSEMSVVRAIERAIATGEYLLDLSRVESQPH